MVSIWNFSDLNHIKVNLIISGILFMLTHQYKPTGGQSGWAYYKADDELTEIPTNIPSEAVVVTIVSRQITTVESNSFIQLSQCTHLHLGSNISEIEPGAFNGLSSLTNLSLSHNRLQQLHVNMFSGINSCEMLHLAQNQISQI